MRALAVEFERLRARLRRVERRPQPQLAKVVSVSPLTVLLFLDSAAVPIGVDLKAAAYTPNVGDRVLLVPVQGQWVCWGQIANA